MAKTIHLSEVLNELDIKIDAFNRPVYFSVAFIIADGRYVYLNKAYSVGSKANMKKNSIKGFQPVDGNGEKIGHIYQPLIWTIVEFNGKPVSL